MDCPGDFDRRLELFFGQASDTLARVYARLREIDSAHAAHLTGTLCGPSCLYAETLPARFALVDRGPGRSLVAEAIVSEPCFWTPEMPHVYQAAVELRHGGEVLGRTERMFGIRTLGAAGRNLVFNAKRWVLRGMRRCETRLADVSEWHRGDLAMLVANPLDALCEEASRVGVLIVAQLEQPDADEIKRLSRWPAVGIVAMPGDATVDLRGLAHNLLLAANFEAGRPLVPPAWAQLALVAVTDRDSLARRLSTLTIPVIATHVGDTAKATIADGRAACDRLQGELAALAGFDFAGFIV